MKFPNSIRNHKKKSAAILLVILLIITSSFILLKKDTPLPIIEPAKYYSALTGEEVSQDESERPVLAVMIENSEAARPQTGLDSAGIVFETTTEAGITRYLALYQNKLPETVGPVRSVRPAFVDWLMGFDASVAHVGGSATALKMLEDRKAKSLNQFFNEGPYFRSDEREAPHNMYADVQKLYDLIDQNGNEQSNFLDIPRGSAPSTDPKEVAKVVVDFSSPEFTTEYVYDANTKLYMRYLAGEPHIDQATGKPITVSNVVVLKMGNSIDALGEGEAYIFQAGKIVTGRWVQENYENRIRFYQTIDNQEQEVQLLVGDSWIAAIPSSGSVTY